MARKVEQKSGWFPFGPRNRKWLLIALGTIVVGYIFLSIGPWDSVWSLTIAAILLGAGYFVLLPYAILARNEPRPPREKPAEQPVQGD